MANLGDMVVSIVGDTAGFDKSLTDTQKKMAGFAINVAAVTAAVVQTIKVIAKATKEYTDYGSQIDDARKRTGLSSKAIQEWKYIAEQAGTTLEAVTGSVALMTRGLETNKKRFEELGVATRNADGSFRSTTDIFNDTISALSNMQDETKRDQLAFQILGRSAQSLIPILKDGSAGLDAMKKEARDLGIILDADTITQADALGDAMLALKTSMTSAKNNMINEMAPALIKIADYLKGQIEISVRARAEWDAYQNAAKGTKQTQEQLSDAIRGTIKEEERIAKALEYKSRLAPETVAALEAQLAATKALEQSLRSQAVAMASANQANLTGTAIAQAKAAADAEAARVAKEAADAAAAAYEIKKQNNIEALALSEAIAKQRADDYGDWIVRNAEVKGSVRDLYETRQTLEIDWQALQDIGIKNTLMGFEAIGAAFVDGENGWKVFAKAGILAIASILEALGGQLAAMSALNFVLIPPNIIGGIKAAAGSAAAYVAAGAVRASAAQLAEGGIVMPTEGGTLAQIAEAGQPEAVIPLDKLGSMGGQMHLVVNLDSRPLLDKIFDATKNRTVLISAGAVV